MSSCRLLYHLGECQNYLCIVLSCVVLLYQPTPASTGVDITPSGSTRSWSGLYYIADSKAARPVAGWLGERERERERDSLHTSLFPTMASSFVIKTPCSSANIGPGFDVIGLALSLHLELHVTIDSTKASQSPLNCVVTYDDQSNSAEEISLDPEVNLITRVALYVLRCHDQRAFPAETHVHIVNPIPLGRGLGSSGTAVVAGVMLGNEVGRLGLSKERLLDYCLMIGKFGL